MKWRIIKCSEQDAYTNMALDEAIAEGILSRESDPTIRFYTWKPSAVSIGYFQSMEKEVNLEECEKQGIDVIRRRTGGGAVYHDNKGEITYSVLARKEELPKSIIESYKLICSWIVSGLKLLGLEAGFHPINDIIVAGKKISGNAQTRRSGILQQHGTILYGVDVEKMFSLLKVGSEKISDKIIASVKERVTSIQDQCKASRSQVEEALLEGFTKGKEHYMGEYSGKEKKRAAVLAKEKYKSREWNFWR